MHKILRCRSHRIGSCIVYAKFYCTNVSDRHLTSLWFLATCATFLRSCVKLKQVQLWKTHLKTHTLCIFPPTALCLVVEFCLLSWTKLLTLNFTTLIKISMIFKKNLIRYPSKTNIFFFKSPTGFRVQIWTWGQHSNKSGLHGNLQPAAICVEYCIKAVGSGV